MKTKSFEIVCFGDSITNGNPGVSYLRYLQSSCKNYGIGGITLLELSNRIKSIVVNEPYKTCILEVGANDILLPFLLNYSKSWREKTKRIIDRGSIPLATSEEFINEYQKLLHFLLNQQASVIVVSIPCLSENLEWSLNLKVNEYNQCVEKLCKQLNITYIDFNTWQKEIIIKTSISSDYFIHKDYYTVMTDTLMTTMGFSEYLSKKRKLFVTVDGIHLNHRGARGLALLVNNYLSLFSKSDPLHLTTAST